MASLVNDRIVDGVHDVSEGGVALTLAEMAVRSGIGVRAEASDVFVESPSRVVVCVRRENLREVHRRHVDAGVDGVLLGEAGGDRLVVDGPEPIAIALVDVADAWRDRIPGALGAGTTQG